MAGVRAYELPWGDRLGLLVADVPWETLRTALRDLRVQTDVRGSVGDWLAWDDDWSEEGAIPVLAGELDGRSYLYDRSGIVPAAADMIVELARRTGGLVLGHSYDDTAAVEEVTAARGATLLRYRWGTAPPEWHEEGAPLPGETSDAPVSSITGMRRVLAALGFSLEGPDGWLARGAKRDVRWIDPASGTAAHRLLHFGPRYERIRLFQEAYLEGLDAEDAAPEASSPSPRWSSRSSGTTT
jgi:hypothetical protein